MLTTYPTLCGSVAGRPSPLGVKMHDAGYASLGLDFKYVAMGTDDLAAVVQVVRTLGFRGLGVSMPFKQQVIDFLDDVSEEVKIIGACNTVVNSEGKLVGYNTDYRGALRALEESGSVDEWRRAVIVGSGGVARAIAYGLKRQGLEVVVAARNASTRDKLVAELKLQGGLGLEEQGDADAELVVNATPVAEAPGGPVNLEAHRKARALLDVVFQTRETQLTEQAARIGWRAVRGWRMLLHQGLEQFELYTGEKPPVEVMAQVLEDALPQ